MTLNRYRVSGDGPLRRPGALRRLGVDDGSALAGERSGPGAGR